IRVHPAIRGGSQVSSPALGVDAPARAQALARVGPEVGRAPGSVGPQKPAHQGVGPRLRAGVTPGRAVVRAPIDAHLSPSSSVQPGSASVASAYGSITSRSSGSAGNTAASPLSATCPSVVAPRSLKPSLVIAVTSTHTPPPL